MIIRMSKNQLNAVSAINRKCSHYFKLNANLRRVAFSRVAFVLRCVASIADRNGEKN